MILKRRNPRTWLRSIAEFFWPRGGWLRASTYILHRMRRLPDTPERICIGIAAGTFVSFLPIWGLHFLSAALVAWILRGNILAALLGTFYGNPFTFPLIAFCALETGHFIFGTETALGPGDVVSSVGLATSEITHNLWALVSHGAVAWTQVGHVFHDVFLPFFVGGFLSGIPISIGVYLLHLPLVRAYQKRRKKRLQKNFEAARRREAHVERDAPHDPDTR